MYRLTDCTRNQKGQTIFRLVTLYKIISVTLPNNQMKTEKNITCDAPPVC